MPSETLSIQAGRFRHTIAIQAPSTSQNTIGAPLTTWTTVLTTKAEFLSQQTATYKAVTADGTVTSQASYLVTLRFPKSVTITTAMRILFRGQAYSIASINDILQRRMFVQLFCMTIDGTA